MGDKDYDLNEGQESEGQVSEETAYDKMRLNADPDADVSDNEALAMAAAQGLQDEVDKLNDKVLRLAAELENTRRRGEKEKVDAGKYAIANFARDLLSVADNFERGPDRGARRG